MPQISRNARATSRLRVLLVPALALVAMTAAATASATPDAQPKPSLKVEGQRTSLGARLTFTGANWPAGATISLTGTRPPGGNRTQTFKSVEADSTGSFKASETAQCTTSDLDMAREAVTITAADSSGKIKATARVDGSSWVCQ